MAETVSKRLEVLEFEIVQKDRLEIILVSVEIVSGYVRVAVFLPKTAPRAQLADPTSPYPPYTF